ncbi:MAG: aminotransferase class IV [Pyrinomonadaceae bacterium]
MHDFVSFDREIVQAERLNISALSSAAIYGKGIFTTVAIAGGEPFLWEKHWRRLQANAPKLRIDLNEFSETATSNALTALIQKNSVAEGRARITFFDDSPSNIWPFETSQKTSLLIATGDLRTIADHFRLTISPYPVHSGSPLAGVKSCNYLENILAFDEAKDRGFNEAIRTNEHGHITSGCMANVFWLKDDVLYTPNLKTGCLAGTTREFVLENLECREVEAAIGVLDEADAMYLTSAGLGVTKVAEFESKQLKKILHPIADLLLK